MAAWLEDRKGYFAVSWSRWQINDYLKLNLHNFIYSFNNDTLYYLGIFEEDYLIVHNETTDNATSLDPECKWLYNPDETVQTLTFGLTECNPNITVSSVIKISWKFRLILIPGMVPHHLFGERGSNSKPKTL